MVTRQHTTRRQDETHVYKVSPVRLYSLRKVTLSIFIVLLLAISAAYFFSMSFQVVQASTLQSKVPAGINFYADTVLVMDNVNQIATHDGPGYRFDAAQLFVDLAPPGDEIGLVKITSSPTPAPVLPLQPVTNGRQAIKAAIQTIKAGGVDTNQTAYFTPALQAAGTYLQASPSGHRKYVIIITDSLAQSGDQNAGCNTPLNQQWLCEVDVLEKQGISVVLLGFTPAGRDDEFLTTETALQAHGASAIKMVDNTSFPVLAQHYTDLLVSIHPSLFAATLNGLPLSITTTTDEALARLTFLTLGDSTTLTLVTSSSGQKVSEQSTSDNMFYFSSGRGYSLQTIGTGNLVGQWKLTTSGSAPTETIVIAQSKGNFALNNPAPSGDDLSARYVPSGQALLLLSDMTDTNGLPLNGITLTANPSNGSTQLTVGGIPGYPNTFGAILNTPAPPAPGNNTTPLFIGLGQPLTITAKIYLTKTFQLVPLDVLKNQGVNIMVPPSSTPAQPLSSNASIVLKANAHPNTPIKGQSFEIAARDATINNSPWQLITTHTTSDGNIAGDYSPPRGCGVRYIFAAFAEVSGNTSAGTYDYLTYMQGSDFISYVRSVTKATPTPVAPTYLGWWWDTSVYWQINVQSTVCTPQTLTFTARPALHTSAMPAIVVPAGSLSANISGNTQTNFPLNATIKSCSVPIFSNQQFTYQLVPSNMPAGNTLQKLNPSSWQMTVTCPSLFTNSARYWPLGIIGWFLFTIVVARGVQFFFLVPLTAPIRKPHLVGKLSVDLQAANPPLGQQALPQATIPINIPPTRSSDKWYLETRAEGGYRLSTRETPESALLQFMVKRESRGYSVTIAATRYAKGEKLPVFLTTQEALEQTPIRCIKGNAIIIKNDIIYPDLDVAIW